MEWSVKIEANNIIVACSEYTNWEDIWRKAKGFLFTALKKFNIEENPVIEIVLQCVDKFTFDEDLDKFQISEIFNLDSEYLSRNVTIKSSNFWHLHQGWFESFNEEMKALHNLNLSACKKDKDQPYETAISHLVKISMKDESSINDINTLCGNNQKTGYLEGAMDAAHKSNKDVLLNLLSHDMANKIGLKG